MSIGNYKVGDGIRIKKDLVKNKNYGGLDMNYGDKINYVGKEAKITKISIDNYSLDIDNGMCCWNDEMLEPVVEQSKYVKCIDNNNVESELELGKIYKIKKIHKGLYAFVNEGDGYELEGFTYSFYSSRFVPVSYLSNPKPQSTKSIIKIRQVGDTTYATYNTHKKGKSTRNSAKDEYNKEYGILLATARALNISEDKVKGIIDVLFDEGKEKVINVDREFKVGDRVIGVGKICSYSIDGISGIIRSFDSSCNTIGVEFDKNVNGHTLDGLCIDGYGWNVRKESVKLLPQTIKSLQQENKELKDTINKIKLLLTK